MGIIREVGRIERALFTLDWLGDPALRRQAIAELNKGESPGGRTGDERRLSGTDETGRRDAPKTRGGITP